MVPSSVTSLRHVVKRRDVELHTLGVMVKVPSTKTLNCEEYVLEIPIYNVPESKFCVASAVQRYLHETPGSLKRPIFLKRQGICWPPLLYEDILSFSKFAVANKSTHSLRWSGACFLHGIVVSLEDIMAMGDWKSLAVLDYLITPVSRKQDIQQKVASALK